MSNDPLLGSVGIFAGNFAPRGWAFCDGQLLPISQNTALFSLLGTIYGGDGRTTFALPDLRGRSPISSGNGPGLSSYREGQRTGRENVTLQVANLPSHNHPNSGSAPVSGSASLSGTATCKLAVNSSGDTDSPSGAHPATNPNGDQTWSSSDDGNSTANGSVDTSGLSVTLSGATVNGSAITSGNTGGGQNFDIRNPTLAMYYCIALTGTFPSRS